MNEQLSVIREWTAIRGKRPSRQWTIQEGGSSGRVYFGHHSVGSEWPEHGGIWPCYCVSGILRVRKGGVQIIEFSLLVFCRFWFEIYKCMASLTVCIAISQSVWIQSVYHHVKLAVHLRPWVTQLTHICNQLCPSWVHRWDDGSTISSLEMLSQYSHSTEQTTAASFLLSTSAGVNWIKVQVSQMPRLVNWCFRQMGSHHRRQDNDIIKQGAQRWGGGSREREDQSGQP